MTRGIYKLHFEGYKEVYIGQSSNIEVRFCNHKSMLKNNRHYNYKLQKLYNIVNIPPLLEILEEVSEDRINVRESYYIDKFNSIDTGLNISSGGTAGKGTAHGSCKYDRDQLISVLFMCLDPHTPLIDIADNTEVSLSTVSHIANGEVHYWLKDEFPIEYTKLAEIKSNRLRSSSIRSTLTYKFRSLLSPDGAVYQIDNISKFGREHNLDSNKLGEILRGTRKSHRGWVGT